MSFEILSYMYSTIFELSMQLRSIILLRTSLNCDYQFDCIKLQSLIKFSTNAENNNTEDTYKIIFNVDLTEK